MATDKGGRLAGRFWTTWDADGREHVHPMRVWERLHQHGGSGQLPTYAGNAAFLHLHYALTGRVRLLLLAALAIDGEMTIPQMTGRYGWPRTRLRRKLESLRRAGMVERFTVPRTGVTRQWRTLPAWRITREGRRWLWRYGNVSKRILYSDLDEVEIDVCGLTSPVTTLETRLLSELLRPSALAIVKPLVAAGSLTTVEAQSLSGLSDSMCLHHLSRLAQRGLVKRVILPGWEGAGKRPPDTWVLTEDGLSRIRGHVEALLWVTLECGHEPDENDLVFPAWID